MSQNTRKDPRAKVLTMTVRYRSATIDEFIEHHSYDVSRGGMFIKTPSPFPAGTLLKFEVKIAEDQKVMQGVGRVVWKREQSDSDADKPCGMGVKFIKIDEESRSVIERLLKSRAPGGEGAYDSGPVPAVGASVPPPSGPVFPPTSGSERPPEDRTVLKPAAELLQDALQQAGAAGAALPSTTPVAPAEASVETKRSSDRSEPPPAAAEEAAAAAWAHDALASLPDKDSVPPPSSKRAGAVAQEKESTPAPAPAQIALPPVPARASETPPTPERRPSRRPSRPPLAEVEEEGGGGKAVLLLLVAAAVAAGIYFLTKRGHEVPPEPAPAAVQAEPTAPPAPSPAPEATAAPSAAVTAAAPEPSVAPSAEVAPTASAAPSAVPEPEPTVAKPVVKARVPRPKAAPKPAAPKEEAPSEPAPEQPEAPAEPTPSEPKPAPAPAPTPTEATPPAAPQTENPY